MDAIAYFIFNKSKAKQSKEHDVTIRRTSTSSPFAGIFVLMTAIIAAYTDVKMGAAACAFMDERAKRPRPRMRFSPKSSGTRFLMFDVLILLIRPLIDFFSASHVIRWYSFVFGSFTSLSMAASFAGGMYMPPARPSLSAGLLEPHVGYMGRGELFSVHWPCCCCRFRCWCCWCCAATTVVVSVLVVVVVVVLMSCTFRHARANVVTVAVVLVTASRR